MHFQEVTEPRKFFSKFEIGAICFLNSSEVLSGERSCCTLLYASTLCGFSPSPLHSLPLWGQLKSPASWWQLSLKSCDEATDWEEKQQGNSPLGWMLAAALMLSHFRFTEGITLFFHFSLLVIYPPTTVTNHVWLERRSERVVLPSQRLYWFFTSQCSFDWDPAMWE